MQRIIQNATIKLKQQLGFLSPPAIIPYRGFGNVHFARVMGHVLENKYEADVQETDNKMKNIIGMAGRYMSLQIPNVKVEAKFQGQTQISKTDDAGHFTIDFHFQKPITQRGWLPVKLRLLEKITEDQPHVEANGEIYIQQHNSAFGIITDVDDTIMISKSTALLRKLWLITTRNAHTRLPFKGVSEFYRKLHCGPDEAFNNPIFYVSSSEWNLYDFLVKFCEVKNLPKGVFLLQDLKPDLISLLKTGSGTHEHKFEKIRLLLKVFQELPFILIGDSGQRDAYIYSKIAKEFPGKIKAIYIRDVHWKGSRRVKKIADGLRDVDMLLMKTTTRAYEHAREKGFIK